MKKFLLVLILLIDICCIYTGSITVFDDLIYQLLISLKCDYMTIIFRFFTFLGSTPFVLSINIIIFIYGLVKRKHKLFLINCCSLSSVIFNRIFKSIIRRPRPIGINLIQETFYSFPSGHAMISVLFYGSIYHLIAKSDIKNTKMFKILLITIIIMICLSRIYLGVHYASDIIGGIATSLIIRDITIEIFERKS